MKKKLPNTLTTEELLEALNGPQTTAPVPVEANEESGHALPNYEDNSILGFYSKLGVYPGTNPVRLNLLYRIYKFNTVQPKRRSDFYTFSKDYLTHYYVKDDPYVNINLPSEKLLVKLTDSFKNRRQGVRVNKHYRPALEKFFEEYKVKDGNKKPGGVKIEASTLYYFFDKYTYENRKPHVPYEIYCNLLRLYFQIAKTHNVAVTLKVQPSFIKKVGKKQLEVAQEWGRKFRGKKNKSKH